MKDRVKALIRPLIPAHRRFIRSGEWFRVEGEREVHLLPGLVPPGSTVIDVGAHIGDYTYSLCKQVGPTGKVIAIEPQPDLAKLISRATKRLGLPVTVHCCALSATEGEAELVMPTESGMQDPGLATLERRESITGSRRVPLRRLDDICRDLEGISFVKIDVEGHELQVLKGGLEMLRKHRPILLIEIEQRHTSSPITDTFDFICSLGYRGEFLGADGTMQPLTRFDAARHQSMELLRKPGYVNNFVFHPVAANA